MSWIDPVRRLIRPVAVRHVEPKPEEPEPPRASFLEKLVRWRTVFAAQRRAEPSLDQVERAREQQRQARLEAEEDRVAAIIARQGVFFPGDEVDLPRAGAPPGLIRTFGFERWTAQVDWRQDVDARQAEDIAAGGRGPA